MVSITEFVDLIPLKKKSFLGAIIDKEQEILDLIFDQKDEIIKNVKTLKGDNFHHSQLNNKLDNIVKWICDKVDINSSHEKYRQNIVSGLTIPVKYNALAFMRESVDKGFQLKQSLASKSNEDLAKSLGFLPYSIKLTISGYKSPLLAILEKNPQIKAVFVESVDRLSRNLALTIDLLDYCSINGIQIYVGSSVMNRGVGRATLLLLSVFAEFELTSKQTSYSKELLNVIKLELKIIKPVDMTDSELKLFNNLQFIEQESVFKKALALSSKYKYHYENETMIKTKLGFRRKANNIDLYNNSNEIIKLLSD